MSAGPSRVLIAGASIASAALVVVYLALGGGAYQPTEVADAQDAASA